MKAFGPYLVAIFLLGHIGPVKAQLEYIDVERVSADFGMPNGNIVKIVEDGFGFLWLATDEGLFRYDGYEFKAYRHDVQDSTTLAHTSLNSVLVDQENKVWVATTYGLNLQDRRTGSFEKILPFPDQGRKLKGSNYVNGLYQDSRHNLWLSCQRQLFRYDPRKSFFQPINHQDNPEDRFSFRSFFEDQEGTIWVGTENGLLKIDGDQATFEHILPDPDPGSKFNQNLRGICAEKETILWLATEGGLMKWNHQTGKIETGFLPDSLQGNSIKSLMQDHDGNLWMSIDKNGIGFYRPDNQAFHHLSYRANQTNSLPTNTVTCLFEDRYKNIWVGTSNGVGKLRIDHSGFKLIRNEPSYENLSNHVIRVMQSSNGDIWSKTPEGFYHIKNGSTKGKKINELEPFKEYVGRGWFLEDFEGGIWVSVGEKGIYRRSKSESEFKKMPLSKALSNQGINRMMFDVKNKEVLWIGSFEGLCRLNWKTLEEKWYRPQDDLPEVVSNRVAIFEQYKEDEIWLYYTYSNSIGRFDKNTEKFELYIPPADKSSVLEGAIKDISIGKDGNLWLANLYGLTNFNIPKKEFSIYGKKEGMLENELFSVLIDKQDQVWVCGTRFFSRFDLASKTFTNYDVGKEVRHFHTKSKHVAEDGTISLGSLNGIYSFHPQKINKNQLPPTVVLTDFKVKNETYLLKDAFEKTNNIVLSHEDNDITFTFSGLHYINPSGNKYKCKLIGYDEDWRDLGNEHKISYTNLNHGQYEFHALASNSDGVWSEKGLNIQLIITPPFWQTLWFKSLIALVIVSLGYAIFQNRQNQIALQRQKELAEQSAEYKTLFLAGVSHEIRTPMNAIIGLSKLLLDTELNKKQNRFIQAIQQSSQNLLTIINDLLDHTKLEAGKFTFVEKPFSLTEIIHQLYDILKFKADEKNLNFDLHIDEKIPSELIGDPLRLTQILTNLLGNAIKFTEQGRIWLNIEKIKDEKNEVGIRFEVGDTGMGIPASQLEDIFEEFNQAENNRNSAVGTGLGLSIARQLVERQGGQLFIESKLNKGTILKFELAFTKTIDQKKPADKIQFDSTLPTLDILIVEDNQFNQMLLVEILNKYNKGLRIDIAGNGKIALEKLGQHNYDIIIMDIKMPVMDGHETTQIIRKSENVLLREMPILAVTANALPEQLEKCKASGMNDHITKPIDESLLIEKINSLVKDKPQINLQKLRSYLANDEAKVQQFLNIFKSEIPVHLKSILEDISEKDWGQVSISAHTIKNQCRYLGLDKIADHAQEIEILAEGEKDLDKVYNLAAELNVDLNSIIEKELSEITL